MTDSAPKQEKKKETAAKRPSAQKRNLQSQKNNLRNRSHKAAVVTAIRSISQNDAPEQKQAKLQLVYSLMDKGVKRGIFKANKAARTKSRIAARVR
jgi:small subunit ribosomal protein S20